MMGLLHIRCAVMNNSMCYPHESHASSTSRTIPLLHIAIYVWR